MVRAARRPAQEAGRLARWDSWSRKVQPSDSSNQVTIRPPRRRQPLAVAAYLARFKGSSREHTIRSALLPHLVPRTAPGPASRAATAPGAVHPVDAGNPPVQALHHLPAVLRHTFVTTMLDAGVDLRDVQIAARHADPRTTMRYDRARQNLDRHPNYILAAFMASGT